MKLLIAALISAALFLTIPQTQSTPINNSTKRVQVTQAVQAVIPDKVTEIKLVSAQTEQQAVDTSEKQAPQVTPQGCEAYKSLLSRYDWDAQVMAAVMQAESSCNPNAVNPVNYDGVGDYGLMQLHGQEIYDPATNIAHAYSLWTTQGYHAWSVYNSGAYLKFL